MKIRPNRALKPISKKRQKELLLQFSIDDPIDINDFDKLNEDEQHFIMVEKVLNSKYSKVMNIFDFLTM